MDASCNGENDYLELYLDGLFKNGCKITMEPKERAFIEDGAVHLVGDLLDKIHGNFSDLTTGSPDNISGLSSFLMEVKRKGVIPTRCTRKDIIGVGSFYEGRRNKFPNEFDYIAPLFCFEPTEGFTYWHAGKRYHFLAPMYQIARSKIEEQKDPLIYPHGAEKPPFVCFDKYVEDARAAIEVNFKNVNQEGHEQDISVDSVPAAILKGDFSE